VPKVPTIATILADIDRVVPSSSAAGWDPSGLQIGDPGSDVVAVGVCHEVTEAVVAAVEQDPLGLLVTYHPLLFHPTRSLLAGPSPAGRALRLISAGVGVAVAHTSFDVAPGGTADALAAALELDDVGPFGPVDAAPTVKVVTFVPEDAVERVATAMEHAGGGRIGAYSGCSFRSPGVGAFVAGPGTDPVAGTVGSSRVPEVRLEMLAPTGRRAAVLAALAGTHPYEEPPYDVYESNSNARFVGRIGIHRGSTRDLVALVGRRLGDTGLRVSGAGHTTDPRVAVVPGSGSSLIQAARSVGADVIVTGDVDHHRVVAACRATSQRDPECLQ